MIFRREISAAGNTTILVSVLVFHLTTVPCQAADPNRHFDSGQPRELINQPVCWPAEQSDDPHACDFAHRT